MAKTNIVFEGSKFELLRYGKKKEAPTAFRTHVSAYIIDVMTSKNICDCQSYMKTLQTTLIKFLFVYSSEIKGWLDTADFHVPENKVM